MHSLLFHSATVLSFLASHLALVDSQGIEPPIEFVAMAQIYQQATLGTLSSSQCNEDNIVVRRSWDSMSPEDRIEDTDAVLCLHNKPPAGDPAIARGNRNRMDDFTFTHINQTMNIHQSGFLLPWHRYFVWQYEKALRDECGYTGGQPYWDIPRWENNIEGSAVFDGSNTSLGGNGAFIPNRGPKFLRIPTEPPLTLTIPAGTGGGCVETGPFSADSFNVSLGPVTPGTPPASDSSGTAYNPRCLTRDFLNTLTVTALTWKNVTDALHLPDINAFRPFTEGSAGIHGAMHNALGGDVSDFFSSPGDPAFYFIHTWFDRVWSIWQGQDLESRRDALNGTQTFGNVPPSGDVTVDTYMNMVLVGGLVRVGDVMSTTSGMFCYRYD